MNNTNTNSNIASGHIKLYLKFHSPYCEASVMVAVILLCTTRPVNLRRTWARKIVSMIIMVKALLIGRKLWVHGCVIKWENCYVWGHCELTAKHMIVQSKVCAVFSCMDSCCHCSCRYNKLKIEIWLGKLTKANQFICKIDSETNDYRKPTCVWVHLHSCFLNCFSPGISSHDF